MLPDVSKLRLDAHEEGATGEWYPLSASEARKLRTDPVTHERLEPNRHFPHKRATYRLFWDQDEVRRNPPGHRDHMRYAVYNAESLWEWLKDHPKDPFQAFTVSWKDWAELYKRYGKSNPMPNFVTTLETNTWPDFGRGTYYVQRQHGVSEVTGEPWSAPHWEAFDAKGALKFRRIAGSHSPTHGFYFEGPRGSERLVKILLATTSFELTGEKGEEVVTFAEDFLAGTRMHFLPKREVSRALPGQTKRYAYPDLKDWDIAKRCGRKTLVEKGATAWLFSGEKPTHFWHYEGAKDVERLTKVVFRTAPGGEISSTIHYKGQKGSEHAVKQYMLRENVTRFLRGEKTKEYTWMIEYPGKIVYFEGARGEEAIRKIVFTDNPDGLVEYYEGTKGNEVITASETHGKRVRVAAQPPANPQRAA